MLKNIWLSYRNLRFKTYEIEYQKKEYGNVVTQKIKFEFLDINFKHISGLHKLCMPNLRDAKVIPDKILREEINFDNMRQNKKFEKFLRRATASQLLSIVLNNGSNYSNIYEYTPPKWSKLNADFLIHFKIAAYDYYLFLKKINKPSRNNGILGNGTISCAPVSFFRNEPNHSQQKRYEQGQTKVNIASVLEIASGGAVTQIYP